MKGKSLCVANTESPTGSMAAVTRILVHGVGPFDNPQDAEVGLPLPS